MGPTDQLQSKTHHHRLSSVLGAVTYETIQKVCVCVSAYVYVCVWSVAVPWVIINRRRSWYGRATGALQSMVSQGALGHLPQPVHSMGEVGDGGVEEGLSWEYCGSATSLKPTWNLHKVLRQRMNTRTQSPSKGSSQSIAVKEHKHKLGRSKVKNYLHLKHIIAMSKSHRYTQWTLLYPRLRLWYPNSLRHIHRLGVAHWALVIYEMDNLCARAPSL